MVLKAILTKALWDKHITQSELAKKAGTTEAQISRIINTAQVPRFTTLQKIGEVLELDPEELWKAAKDREKM